MKVPFRKTIWGEAEAGSQKAVSTVWAKGDGSAGQASPLHWAQVGVVEGIRSFFSLALKYLGSALKTWSFLAWQALHL